MGLQGGDTMAVDRWERLRRQAEDDDQLYDRFAKALEEDHEGEFVAISQDGRVIVACNDIEVVQRAVQEFGSGNFAFRRIGHKAVGKWRKPV